MYIKMVILLFGYTILTIFGLVIRKMLLNMGVEIEETGIKNAGLYIGIFERILIFSLVLTNQYAAISIVFAAKSIARFKELGDRNIAEYYLLGTLISITSAVILGIVLVIIFGYI